MEFKVGDEVLVEGRGSKKIGTIYRITATGLVRVQIGEGKHSYPMTFHSDTKRGTSHNQREDYHITLLTKELKEQYKEETHMNNYVQETFYRFLHYPLTYEQAIRINEVLDEFDEETNEN